MKCYIDLGLCDEKTILVATEVYPDMDLYLGFEPIPLLYKKTRSIVKRFLKNTDILKKVKIINSAASVEDSMKTKMFFSSISGDQKNITSGSTLRLDKITGGVSEDRFIYVRSINFSKYLLDNFKKGDYIVLKVDIEGEEYSIFDHMIETGAINLITKIFCEWHYRKLSNIDKKFHFDLVDRINKCGFDLTGDNNIDDFGRLYKCKRKRYMV